MQTSNLGWGLSMSVISLFKKDLSLLFGFQSEQACGAKKIQDCEMGWGVSKSMTWVLEKKQKLGFEPPIEGEKYNIFICI